MGVALLQEYTLEGLLVTDVEGTLHDLSDIVGEVEYVVLERRYSEIDGACERREDAMKEAVGVRAGSIADRGRRGALIECGIKTGDSTGFLLERLELRGALRDERVALSKVVEVVVRPFTDGARGLVEGAVPTFSLSSFSVCAWFEIGIPSPNEVNQSSSSFSCSLVTRGGLEISLDVGANRLH